jgi:hypothetical protein
MINKTELVSNQDGATAKKRAYRRKPVTDAAGTGGGTAKPRRRKPAPNQVDVFGVHAALYDRMQQQAELAKIIKKHLEAMQAEFDKLSSGGVELSAKLIDKMAQCGMDTLQNMALVPRSSMAKDDPELKRAVNNL